MVLGEADATVSSEAGGIHPMLQGANLENSKKSGIVITEVAQGSPAAMNGLKKGDVIVGINRDRISDLKTLKEQLKDPKGSVALKILRDGSLLYLILR